MEQKSKTYIRPIVIVMIFAFLTIGYAYLTSALNINGSTLLKKTTWDVHFENVQVNPESVSGDQVIDEPEIDSEQTTVTFHVNLKKPGDFYEFTVDAVNAGTIDAMIDTYTNLELTEAQQAYLESSVTYEDGEEIQQHQQLLAGDTAVYKIRVAYKFDLDADDLPTNPQQLSLSFTVNHIQRDSDLAIRRQAENTLYNVLKDAVDGGLARKYVGEHQDSMNTSLSTKDIYYWYANDNTVATNISENMNNVIFANHCWQMFRTTDTGGVKLIYNGEVENNQCMSTRGSHIGYNGIYSLSGLNNNYYYGTDYTYDANSKKFSLSGNVVQAKWSESVGPSLIGYYTCKLNDINSSCSTLYYIYNYSSTNSASVIRLNSSSTYSKYGVLPFNTSGGFFDSVGYMYKKKYAHLYKDYRLTDSYPISSFYYSSLNSYYVSDTAVWDNSTNMYTLQNPEQLTEITEPSDYVNKYFYRGSSSNMIYYIYELKNSTYYYLTLSNGETVNDFSSISFTYGSSYNDNGDGTYTINNPSTIQILDITDNTSALLNKYVCKNAVNNTCNDLRYVSSSTYYENKYYSINRKFRFGNGFTYSNGNYTLTDGIEDSWKLGQNFGNVGHKYTCFNESGVCDTLYYYYFIKDYSFYYLKLQNGESISDALETMLYADDLNTQDSIIKKFTDLWYEKYLYNYSDYLEDVIYCNNRKIVDYGSFIPNTTVIDFLRLKDLRQTTDLSCEQITDRFSVSNNSAKLKYKVGQLTAPELFMLNNGSIVYCSDDEGYWLMSPDMATGKSGTTRTDNINVLIGHNGSFGTFGLSGSYYNYYYGNFGLRPVISIKPGTLFSSGDGSMENPYVINTN